MRLTTMVAVFIILLILPHAHGSSQEQPEDGASPYTGEIVTFNLVGSDIRDFFRVIAELSGLNIIVDGTVTGELTMILNDVPWDQALDLVLRINSLGYELQGNVLRIAPQAALRAAEDARRTLREAQALNVPLETRAFILSYTSAEAVNTIIQGLLSERGSSVVDPRRNALIVTDVPDRIGQITAMIEFQGLGQPSRLVR